MKLHHIAIIASDREKAIVFYGVLGFEVTGDYIRPERDDEIIMMSDGETTLELFIKDAPPRPSYPEARGLRHLAFHVDDIYAIVEKFRSAGYEPEPIRRDSITGKRMTFVPDPDKLPIELHE